ncbi:MAG: DUF2304 domain-containing protein [Gammaproteobacteria bacterium]|nr:DUF2304 domain-containing protein [Gammaproteobacteria bacterium]
MIITIVLTGGLLFFLAYGVLQARRSRFLAAAVGLVSIGGIALVLAPDSATRLAQYVGVGRGADLVLYCWIVVSLIVSLGLYLRIVKLHEAITLLARDAALKAAAARSGRRE